MQILLLDDHGLVRAGIKALLAQLAPQADLIEGASFESALEILQHQHIDIALVDIDLRGAKTGIDFLSYVRRSDLDTKIIMLSGSDDRETVLQCLAEGASGYVPKGSKDGDVLRCALEIALQGGIYLPPSTLDTGGRSLPPTACRPKDFAIELPSSKRLREVLYYVCQGLTNKGIARRMGISEGTVRKNYVGDLLAHFGVSRRTELIIEVARQGIRVQVPVP
jgi:two-component system nitrate/nitrite response regulator NarL